MSNLSGLLPAGGGAWTLVSTMTPSAASTIDITDFTAYEKYKIVFSVKGSSNHSIRFKLKINGAWITTYYSYTGVIYRTGTTSVVYKASSNSSYGICSESTANVKADRPFSYEFFFHNPTLSTDSQQIAWKGQWRDTGTNGESRNSEGMGTVVNSGGIGLLEGFRLYPSTGTYTGTVYIYGLTATEI